MKTAKLLAALGVAAMSIVLVYGFTVGNFSEDGRLIVSNPWGIVSLVDLYAGFTMFSIWIAYRERSVTRALPWIIGMMVLGFFTGSLYMLYALLTSGGDWHKVWLGKAESRHASG